MEMTPSRLELSPVNFLHRNAQALGQRPAVVHGERRLNYAQLAERCHRLASALRDRGLERHDRVAVLTPNTPALLEAHFGVPLAGGVLVAMNTRLSPAEVEFILKDSGARMLLIDSELKELVDPGRLGDAEIVVIADTGKPGDPYEELLAAGSPEAPDSCLEDENEPIAINYTSGTTGRPKGATYTHRGAFLRALGVAMEVRLGYDSVHLWTLPMFHCDGWCLTWGVTAAGGAHVCLRRVEPGSIWELFEAEGVTHYSGAPTIHTSIVNHEKAHRLEQGVTVPTGGSPPTPAPVQGLLLDPAAHLIDHAEAELDHVEGVQHPHRGGQLAGQRCGVAAERIKSGEADLALPAAITFGEPAGVDLPGAAGQHLEQPGRPSRGQVGDPGGELGHPAGVRVLPDMLIHAQPGHARQPARVVGQRLAVVMDRPHHRAPANSELAGHRGHRLLVPADPLTRPAAGPLGQRSPRRDRRAGLGPGPPRAARIWAPPDPLEPDQQHRPPRGRDVTHQVRTAAVRHRDHPTVRASQPPGGRLDQQLKLTSRLAGGHHHKPGQAEHRRGRLRAGNVKVQLGPPMIAVAWSLRIMKVPVLFRPLPHRCVAEQHPRFMAKSRERPGLPGRADHHHRRLPGLLGGEAQRDQRRVEEAH
jgi:hypothetical protein